MDKIAGIKHIFFDLDRTLWDFEKNSETVLQQLIHIYGLESKCSVSSAVIIEKYREVNKELWNQYSRKEIDKEQLRSSQKMLVMLLESLETFSKAFLLVRLPMIIIY